MRRSDRLRLVAGALVSEAFTDTCLTNLVLLLVLLVLVIQVLRKPFQVLFAGCRLVEFEADCCANAVRVAAYG